MNPPEEMTSQMIIQYSIVGIILLVACGWIIWKLFRKNKKNTGGSCCGCAIETSCKKRKKYGNN